MIQGRPLFACTYCKTTARLRYWPPADIRRHRDPIKVICRKCGVAGPAKRNKFNARVWWNLLMLEVR